MLSVAAVFIAVIAGIVFINRMDGGSAGRDGRGQDSLVGVKVIAAQKRDMRDMRIFTGTLSAVEEYDAAAKIGGQVEMLAADLGDCVRKGDVIARLDDEEYKQQLAQARAEIDVAQASLAEAESTLLAAERSYERVKNLREQRVASASELDAAETELKAQKSRVELAKSQIKQREASLRAAEVRLSYTVIKADWENGDDDACRYVAARHTSQGTMLGANSPVVTLVDLSLLKAVINVTERDYASLQVGQPAAITLDFLDRGTFDGEVKRLAPVFGEASRQARVEIDVENPDNILKAGMFVRVHIELGREEDTIAVPQNALVQRGAARGVYIVNEDDTVNFSAVEPGISQDGWVAVSGVDEGDRVVTLGHHLLSEGMRVTATPDDMESRGGS